MSRKVLITGISGFIAKHVALEFLRAGYDVRGTVRSTSKAQQAAETLGKHTDISKVEFVEADLLSDAGWEEAVTGCNCVAHIASPFPLAQPKDEDELIRPAVDGTLRVLRAAKQKGVERFVQTSSIAAIIYGHDRRSQVFTETDWTVVGHPDVTPYAKSKTLAERAARRFIDERSNDLHFASVNPGFVWGPALDQKISGSLDSIRMFLAGKYPGIPKIKIPAVDVRDIARMHRLAMETGEPSGGRYVGVSDTLWMSDMASALRQGLGERANKVPKIELPDFIMKLIGLFDPVASAFVPELSLDRYVDCSRTREALGIGFIPADEAAIATGKSLIDLGVV